MFLKSHIFKRVIETNALSKMRKSLQDSLVLKR